MLILNNILLLLDIPLKCLQSIIMEFELIMEFIMELIMELIMEFELIKGL